ncbi:uncharacterized protein [Solanum tuberosum]|uniref:uncharacterized protein n=1 Tax=Solanum tuberosum TaxID=4113 RepID=UPI000739F8FE|nr:PREDICTED: uncharacterized protein LOC107062128 [Solanum tuberosum]
MTCVKIASYSVIVNDSPLAPFPAKKGLRQGDPLSSYLFVLVMEYLTRILKGLQGHKHFMFHPRCKQLKLTQLSFADDLLLFCKGNLKSAQLLYQAFQLFSRASGLDANIDKSLYILEGLNKRFNKLFWQLYGSQKGPCPSIFWSQVFVLPKKVIQVIDATCRTFLWTGGCEISKRSLIAWERLCLPRVAGGLNILDIYQWNHAAIGKLLWNICRKKDALWVKWVHLYYIKDGAVWEAQAQQASWMVQQILSAKKTFDIAGMTENEVTQLPSYSIRKIYGLLREEWPKIPWRRLVCNNKEVPKWVFNLFLALHKRLQTKDRLACWVNLEDMLCPLCQEENEDIDHLLFQCNYATKIWVNHCNG